MLPGALPRVAVMPGCDRRHAGSDRASLAPSRRAVLSVAQVSGVNGAGPYRPLVANSLLLSHFLKILVPFCAEDY